MLAQASAVYLVRYSGGQERRRPEAVLVVGVLLLLAAGFLVSVAVRVQTQQDIRQQMDHEQLRPGPAVAQSLMSDFDAVESR